MKLRDMKIGTQLNLFLGVILVFVVVLGAVAWVQSGQLWLQTKDLYEHPLTVRRALGKLSVDIERMSLHVRDVLLVRSQTEVETSLEAIAIATADADQQLLVLYSNYLGPQSDVVSLQEALASWSAARDETTRLLIAGNRAEAETRILPGGVQVVQEDLVRSRLQTIDDFAWAKGEQFYRDANSLNSSLNLQLFIIVSVILLLSLVIIWLLRRGIRTPLALLMTATEEFRQGKLDARSNYTSANEYGALSASFNAMADAIQTQMHISENAADLAAVMLREEEMHTFCRNLLKALLTHTGSQVGAIYLINDTGAAYEHFESIGLGSASRKAFSVGETEGELGLALVTRNIQHITDIPADTRFTFASVSGDFIPREILTIPVLSDHSVSAVISLASLRSYDASSIILVNDIWSVLTARMNGVLAFRKINDLAEALEYRNTELDAQKSELAVQTDELTQQNAELEMQKQQLDEANRLKSAFLSNMSHELRTPLNSVIALSGVLSRRLASAIPAEEFGYLEVIERNGRNLLELINDILDLSRIESGRDELGISSFSIHSLISDVVDILQPQATEKKLELLNEAPNDLPFIASDMTKCRHIIQNLVANAVKFTEEGRVIVTASRPGNEFVITVTDTGIGISADQIPHIFDEFRQADYSTSRKYGGTGLGLAIAKKYALLLGGSIAVESAPGKGSEFTVRLPMAFVFPDSAHPEQIEGHPAKQTERPLPVRSGLGKEILVVEDNEPAIIQLIDILATASYRVQVAHNGMEALAQLAQVECKLPDAIILDLMMPGVDGFQVLKELRSMARTEHLPVLILTAKHVTKEELSFLKGNHIHELIHKGAVSREDLLAAVARMVSPPQHQEESVPPSPRRHQPDHPGKPIVLVVEDNLDNLRTARVLLRDRYQVIEATDGQAGVEQARSQRPDLILMDIALPVMDGFGALAMIRATEALRNIPVIAVTASAMKGSREEIMAFGFDGYISKPIDVDVLMKTLKDFLE